MSGIATQAVIALSIALVIWYVVGAQMNRRRASYLLRWVREGIREFGGEATWRRLGASGFQVTVEGTERPFKRIEMMVLLESREIPLLWLFNRFRGQRDLMVFKADLRTRPRTEMEVIRGRGRIAKEVLKAVDEKNWVKGEIEDTNLIVARRGKDIAAMAERLSPLLLEHAPYILRISLRKASPHLLANLSLSGLEEIEAEAVFGLLGSVIEVSQRV